MEEICEVFHNIEWNWLFYTNWQSYIKYNICHIRFLPKNRINSKSWPVEEAFHFLFNFIVASLTLATQMFLELSEWVMITGREVWSVKRLSKVSGFVGRHEVIVKQRYTGGESFSPGDCFLRVPIKTFWVENCLVFHEGSSRNQQYLLPIPNIRGHDFVTLGYASVWIFILYVNWDTHVLSSVAIEFNNPCLCSWRFWRNSKQCHSVPTCGLM